MESDFLSLPIITGIVYQIANQIISFISMNI